MQVGENLGGNIVYVGTPGNSPGHAIDTITGEVYCGNPLLGMSREGVFVDVPAVPDSDASDAAWEEWSEIVQERITLACK